MPGYLAAMIVAALAMPAIASADAPKGRYEVRTVRKATCDDHGKPCKPCSGAAHDHLLKFSRADIVYGSRTIVNEDEWIQYPPIQQKDRGEVAAAEERRVRDAKYHTSVTFWLVGRTAIAGFGVAELGPTGAPVCSEILQVEGTYRPLTP